MIAADALASIETAWILSRILRRSGSTRERLPRVSDRLPPVFCWIAMTMPKKFASAQGMRSNSFTEASASGSPSVCDSMIWRNSLRTGSAASLAMMRRQSLTGRPARMPRTITSSALGNSTPNFLSRLALQRLRNQAGSPKPPMKRPAAARIAFPLTTNSTPPSSRAAMPLIT